jgi:antitoxin ParD1/3/4
MLITIPEDFQTIVSRGVASGRVRSEEEAVCEGLNLLRDRERKLEAVRADLQEGLEQLDAGQSTALDIEDIKRNGRQRLATSGYEA